MRELVAEGRIGTYLQRFQGVRDAGLFESALSRPVNHHLYKPDRDIAELAAAYAFGPAKNHPFIDGNKRTAVSVKRAVRAAGKNAMVS